MERLLTRATWPAVLNLQMGARVIRLMLDVWGERRALERLDARMLADIGLSEADARRESARAVWDTPRW